MHQLLAKADLVIDEILNPANVWCKGGHAITEKVKVYSVQGPSLPQSYWGDYCEPCLAAAHLLAKRHREKRSERLATVSISFNTLKQQLARAGFVGGVNESVENDREPWEVFLEEVG
jgi:hypothetical protein